MIAVKITITVITAIMLNKILTKGISIIVLIIKTIMMKFITITKLIIIIVFTELKIILI